MNQSFEPADKGLAVTDHRSHSDGIAKLGASPATTAVEVFTESDYEDLVDRSHLGVGLAQITSRLLRQLSTSAGPGPQAGANGRAVQRDAHGSRVPLDGSPLVAWDRVIAVSAAGRMLALVVLIPSGERRPKA